MKPRQDVEWVVTDTLARGRRPGYFKGHSVPKTDVDTWLVTVRTFGVKSIICLLGDDQLLYYGDLGTDLISYYRAAGFEVVHVSAPDYQNPPLSADHLAAIWTAYRELPKPVLVHCSAGIDRTGRAVEKIQNRLRQEGGSRVSPLNERIEERPQPDGLLSFFREARYNGCDRVYHASGAESAHGRSRSVFRVSSTGVV